MTKREFVRSATKTLKGHCCGKRVARTKAWQILRALRAYSEPMTEVLGSAGICSQCLEAGWLIKRENGNEKCLNCGAEYLVIEGG